MQLLYSQLWLFIPILIIGALVGGLLYFILHRFVQKLWLMIERVSRNQKEIAYKVITDTFVISTEEEEKGEVQIVFEGAPISNVRLVVLEIWNSGDVNIRPEDFIRPIKFNFGKKAKILEA